MSVYILSTTLSVGYLTFLALAYLSPSALYPTASTTTEAYHFSVSQRISSYFGERNHSIGQLSISI